MDVDNKILEELMKNFDETTADALRVLKSIKENFVLSGDVVFTTSLGEEDQVITDMICKANLDFEIATFDTGRLFNETYSLIERTELLYRKKIKIYFPNPRDVEEYVNTKGINAFYESIDNRKECCRIRKVEPLKRALLGKRVWITGLRRGQSQERCEVKCVEWDDGFGVYKVNPLYNWSLEEVRAYIDKNSVPCNTLHKEGFVSIGCSPCTRKILHGDDIRLGRWWWECETKKECGLHIKKQSDSL